MTSSAAINFYSDKHSEAVSVHGVCSGDMTHGRTPLPCNMQYTASVWSCSIYAIWAHAQTDLLRTAMLNMYNRQGLPTYIYHCVRKGTLF